MLKFKILKHSAQNQKLQRVKVPLVIIEITQMHAYKLARC